MYLSQTFGTVHFVTVLGIVQTLLYNECFSKCFSILSCIQSIQDLSLSKKTVPNKNSEVSKWPLKHLGFFSHWYSVLMASVFFISLGFARVALGVWTSSRSWIPERDLFLSVQYNTISAILYMYKLAVDAKGLFLMILTWSVLHTSMQVLTLFQIYLSLGQSQVAVHYCFGEWIVYTIRWCWENIRH